jgi:predicted O-methyltransferase YrrM
MSPTISELLAVNAYRAVSGAPAGTDKTTTHAYGPIYDRLLEPYRTSAKRVLEIGVWGGASVLALAEFFQQATVDGLDVDMNELRYGVGHPRIRYHVGDGCSPETARSLPGDYDVIIEDASHKPDDQVATLEAFADSLAPGGLYVVEDIGDVSVRPRLAAVAEKRGLEMRWYDLRCVKGQFDDVMATFRRPLLDHTS